MTDSERWRLLPYHRGSSALHFALSDVLVQQVHRPTIWWHATDQPTIILGAGQQWAGPESAAPLQVVRRRAGGTAVYASAGVLGLDVALPPGHPLALSDVVETYRWLGEVWVRTALTLGIPARLVGMAEAREQAGQRRPYEEIVRLACFGSLSPYEVAVGNRKLVGLAQVRRRSGVLLQAGLHRRFDADMLARILAPQASTAVADALRRAALGLDETAARGRHENDVITAFHAALWELHGVTLDPGEWNMEEWQQAQEEASSAM